MGKNHVFKLPSGVECEVTEMMGKHQRLLTEQTDSNNMGENLNNVLLDVIVRLGKKKAVTMADIMDLLAADRQKILIECRQFTMEFDQTFRFTVEYIDENKTKQDYLIEYDFEKQGDFPIDTVKKIGDQGKLVDANFETYEEVLQHKVVEIILPKTKKKVRWTMLDGHGELIGLRTKKVHRSSHTPIKMRKPIELVKSDKSKEPIPVQLNLDTLPFKDIEFLRNSIYDNEGRVGTEIPYKHPVTDKDVFVDVLGVVAFFFPSERV